MVLPHTTAETRTDDWRCLLVSQLCATRDRLPARDSILALIAAADITTGGTNDDRGADVQRESQEVWKVFGSAWWRFYDPQTRALATGPSALRWRRVEKRSASLSGGVSWWAVKDSNLRPWD
jgi:hypothetical protein